jgi:hypothetical protein
MARTKKATNKARGFVIRAKIDAEAFGEDYGSSGAMCSIEEAEEYIAETLAKYIEAFGMPDTHKQMENDIYVAERSTMSFCDPDGHPWCVEEMRFSGNEAIFYFLSAY